jgi:hypothetical protein
MLIGKINPRPGFVKREDVTIGVGDFISEGREWMQVIAIRKRYHDEIEDQAFEVSWDDRENYAFLTSNKLINGEYIVSLADVFPIDDSYDYDPSEQIEFGTVLYNSKDKKYYVFAMSETEVFHKIENYFGYGYIPEDDLSSIQTGWSRPGVFDIAYEEELPDGIRTFDTDHFDEEDLSSLEIATGPYLESGQRVMFKGKYCRYPMLLEIRDVYFPLGYGPTLWTGWQEQDFEDQDFENETEEEEWIELWNSRELSSYMPLSDAPIRLKDYLRFTFRDFVSAKNEQRKIIWDDALRLDFHLTKSPIIKGEDIELLEPPFLKSGEKVTFKSGEDGEGPMKSGVVAEMIYCDCWGAPLTDRWMKTFPWKYVKLSRYLDDLVHEGTNVLLFGEDGTEYLVGGRWIFPHRGKKGDDNDDEEPEVPRPRSRILDARQECEIIPPQAETEAETETEVIPPEMEIVPPQEEVIPPEEEIIPPEEEIIPPEEEIIPPEEEIIPPEVEIVPPEVVGEIVSPPVKPKKKKKKKQIEMEIYA